MYAYVNKLSRSRELQYARMTRLLALRALSSLAVSLGRGLGALPREATLPAEYPRPCFGGGYCWGCAWAISSGDTSLTRVAKFQRWPSMSSAP